MAHTEFARLVRATMLGGLNSGLVQNSSSRLQAAAKAVVGGGALGDAGTAAAFESLTTAWLTALRQTGVFDGLVPDMRRSPMHLQFAVVTNAFVADETGEGKGTAVKSLNLASSQPLRPTKVTAILVATKELLRMSESEGLLDSELKAATVAGVDTVFLGALLGVTTPIASTTSVADIDALISAVALGPSSKPHFVLGVDQAKALTTERDSSGSRTWPDAELLGGQLHGVQVHVTDTLPPGTALFLDAAAVAANPGSVELDSSDQVAIEMSNPSSLSAVDPVMPAQLVSMWQANSSALKASRYFSFEILKPGSVASLSGIGWGATP